jgi:hypothetical protein
MTSVWIFATGGIILFVCAIMAFFVLPKFRGGYIIHIWEAIGEGLIYRGTFKAKEKKVEGNFRLIFGKWPNKKDIPMPPSVSRYPSNKGLLAVTYIKSGSDYYPAQFAEYETGVKIIPVTEGIKLWAHQERKRIREKNIKNISQETR